MGSTSHKPTFPPFNKPPLDPIGKDELVVVHDRHYYEPSLDMFLPMNLGYSAYREEMIVLPGNSAYITTYAAALYEQRRFTNDSKSDILENPNSVLKDNDLDRNIETFSPTITPVKDISAEHDKVSNEDIISSLKRLFCLVLLEDDPITGAKKGTYFGCGLAESHEEDYVAIDAYFLNTGILFKPSKYIGVYWVGLDVTMDSPNMCDACKKWAVKCTPIEDRLFLNELGLDAGFTDVEPYVDGEDENVIGVFKSFNDATQFSDKCNKDITWVCKDQREFPYYAIGDAIYRCFPYSKCCVPDGYDTENECIDKCPNPCPTCAENHVNMGWISVADPEEGYDGLDKCRKGDRIVCCPSTVSLGLVNYSQPILGPSTEGGTDVKCSYFPIVNTEGDTVYVNWQISKHRCNDGRCLDNCVECD